jgi:toxin CcdB
MARYDVYRVPGVPGYWLDCQANILGHLDTRFVVPLLPDAGTPRHVPKLMPLFDIEGVRHVMATQLASAVPTRLLKSRVASLADHHYEILGAIDMLLTGN